MAGSRTKLSPEAPEFVYHSGKPGPMEVLEEELSAQDAEQASYPR